MKSCSKCKVLKESEDFAASKMTKDRLQSWCRSCSNAHTRERRKDDLDYRARRREVAKTDQVRLMKKRYRESEKGRSTVRSARKRLREDAAFKRAEKVFYKLRKSGHCPRWAKLSDVLGFYKAAAELAFIYEVDHIYPLNGETVCGLHVPSNLQLLLPEVNRAKSNSLNSGVTGLIPASIKIPY